MHEDHVQEAPPLAGLLELTGRVALVTGARGGIGAGIAERFAAAGAAVIVHYRGGQDEAGAVVERIRSVGGTAEALQADISDRSAVEQLVASGVAAFGGIDIAVNNAATQAYHSFLDVGDGDWDEAMATNLRGSMLVTQAVASHLIERRSGGSIVQIASILAQAARPATAEYSVSKAGVVMLTQTAALDYGAHGIRVNAVLPGLIDREGLEGEWPEGVERWRAIAPLRRLGTPADVADACLFLASPAARWISGASLLVDGGMSSRAPW